MKKYIFLCFGIVLFVLYGLVGYSSFGYDDEFYNIDLITKFGFGVLDYVQSNEVNPPGSYFIDWLLFVMIGKWNFVRLVISLITATSLIYAIVSINNRHGKFAGVVSFILLGLNPAILIWCTSLRWYAFFVPILIWLSIVPLKQGWQYWAKCFGGLLLLGYLGYAVFIVAIPILLLYWIESNEKTNEKIKNFIRYGFLFLILYSYQFSVFLNVHIHNKKDQISSLYKCLIGFYSAQISNQGVFPLSIPGILAGIATIGIFITILYSNLQVNIKNKYFAPYSLAAILSIFIGIAGKFRNLVIISPWQAFWISTAKIELPQKKLFLLFLTFLTISNVCGDINIMTHRNTTKNEYNLPVKQILEDLSIENKKCKGSLIILCHTRTLSWNLERAGFLVLDPYSPTPLPRQVLLPKYNCLVLLKTWPGSMSKQRYQRLYDEIKLLSYASSKNYKYGKDDFYFLKNKFDSRYPEYSIEVTKYYEVENLTALESWQPITSIRK